MVLDIKIEMPISHTNRDVVPASLELSKEFKSRVLNLLPSGI